MDARVDVDFVFEEPPSPRIENSARSRLALRTVALGLLVGWLSSIFFLDKAVGISFPLFILLLVVTALAGASMRPVHLTWRNLWLVIPSLFFAAMVAVRADPSMTFLNVVLALGLGALWLHYLPLRTAADKSTVGEHVVGVIETSVNAGVAPIMELGHARRWLRERTGERSRTAASIWRGVLLAVPVVLVFAVLLSSADMVFSRTLEQIWEWIGLVTPEKIIYQGLLVILFGWLACGVAAYAAARGADAQGFTSESVGAAAASPDADGEQALKRRPIVLSMIESCIVLGSVNVLFACFVLIQLGYFFGGQDNVSSIGLTYAEYARRGFFELVAVAVLTLGLVLTLDWVTVRSGTNQHRVFRALAVIMILLTGIMMISASQRMSLYESVYGYTHLRVYTHMFIRWLAVLFGFFLLALFRARDHVFSLGVLLCGIGYCGTLNLVNVEAYIAERNIDRYFEGYALDGYYLSSFGVDAAQPMLALWQNPETPSEVRHFAGQWLAVRLEQLSRLRTTTGGTLFSAHLGRDTAWGQLKAADLPSRDNATWSSSLYFEPK